jgi:hypothetical protein
LGENVNRAISSGEVRFKEWTEGRCLATDDGTAAHAARRDAPSCAAIAGAMTA